MKKFLLCLFSFLFITTATIGGGLIFSGCNQTHSENAGGGFDNLQNEVSAQLSGSGTRSSPYLIQSASDLYTLASNINSGVGTSSYYRQTVNIVASSFNTPIGNASNPFRGYYDGDGYIISGINLTSSETYVGLFGYTQGATIHDLGLVECSFAKTGSNGYVGGIVAYAGAIGETKRAATIYNCFNADGTISSGQYLAAGGIAGYVDATNRASGQVYQCYNTSSVSGYYETGGIVGGLYSIGAYRSQVYNCFNRGNVTGYMDAGGIVGQNGGGVSSCYNTGTISGYSIIGGVCGQNEDAGSINSCFNVGSVSGYMTGGVIGEYSSSVSSCYFGENCTSTNGNGNGDENGKDSGCIEVTGSGASIFYDVNGNLLSSWDIENATSSTSSTIWLQQTGINNNYPFLRETAYRISYTLNSGSLSQTPYYGLYGSPVNIQNPTRTGYDFNGWTSMTYNMTITKQGMSSTTWSSWQNGGVTPTLATYFKNLGMRMGNSVTMIANWSACTLTVNFRTSVSNSINLYMSYYQSSIIFSDTISNGESIDVNYVNLNTHTINFSLRNPNSSNGQFSGVSYYFKIGSVPTSTDYDMIAEGYMDIHSYSWNPTRSVTITIYVCERYTISYDGNNNTDGTVPEQQYIHYGGEITLQTNELNRIGHTANGWNTEADGTGTHYDDGGIIGNIISNITLYAEWTVNQYYFDVNVNVNGASYSTNGIDGFTFNLYANNNLIVNNYKDYYQLQDYGTEITVEVNSYPNGYYFNYMNCPQLNLTNSTSTLTFTMPAQITRVYIYFNSYVYQTTLKYENGNNDTYLYLKYDVDWYTTEGCTQTIDLITVPTRIGFDFGGFYTNENGTETQMIDEDGNILAPHNAQLSDTMWYAYWIPKNPARYDSEKGLWYVEMGYFPQSKVTNSTLKNNIKTSGTATGVTYSIAGQTLKEYKYGSNKYALYNGEYYEVEPVKYILQSSSDLKDGFATESGNVTAVSEKVVFASVWNEEYLGLGSGYLNSDLRVNFTAFRAESGMVEDYTQTKSFQLKNFKNANGSGGSSTYSLARGVSSESEIQSVFGDLSAEFSDLVADILGGYLFYWTRDVGSNLNNAQTISASGVTGTQMKMNEILGVRVTVNIKTLACVGS